MRRCAHVIAACRSIGVRSSVSLCASLLLPLPRFAGVTRARCLLLGAKLPLLLTPLTYVLVGKAVTAQASTAVAVAAVPANTCPKEIAPSQSRGALYLWAALLARIYEVLPLICPHCGAEMRMIAAITDRPTIERILLHIGQSPRPPRIAPARGPPQWEWDFDDPHGRGKCRLCRMRSSVRTRWSMP